MRPIQPRRGGRSPWATALMAVLGIAMGGALTFGALWATGLVELPGQQAGRAAAGPPPGFIPVPVAARPIPAYTRVSREDLMNPTTGEWLVRYMDPENLPPNVITAIGQVRGRVTARDKEAPYFFVEEDFLPEGTRPGVVAGIPPGKRSVTLDASRLRGVHGLQAGDRLDLVATISVDLNRGAGRASNLVVAPQSGGAAMVPKRGVVRVLVQDGTVVTPVTTRAIPVRSTSLTQGQRMRTMPVEEILIAVDPDEVAPLAEAINLGYEVTAVARSGRPAAEEASGPAVVDATPGSDPLGEVQVVEAMVGQRRQTLLFAGGEGGSTLVAAFDRSEQAAGEPLDTASEPADASPAAIPAGGVEAAPEG